MIVVNDFTQGEQAWVEARLGIPTASNFSRIVTPGGKLSASRDDYLAELLAEWALGYPVNEFGGTMWMERGKVLENDAFKFYSFMTDTEPTKVGFVYADDTRSIGCSPDFMVGGSPGELKCPNAGKHLLWLMRGTLPREHVCQVQGQMWVTGADRCDFLSYYPELPPLFLRVELDEKYHNALSTHLPAFIEELMEGREKLQELGVDVEQWREANAQLSAML